MSTKDIRLRDLNGNILHPETDWELVQNKPEVSGDVKVNPSNNAFELSDENDNIILQINSEGNIKTKSFDSSNIEQAVKSESTTNTAFELSDENDNIILQIDDEGNVKTKSFDSTTAEQTSNKVTSLSNLSTNTQYPGAKAVYDYAQPKISSGNKLGADLVDDTNSTNKFVTTQTAYTSKGSATKVPQITTNTLGQVTNISEVNIAQELFYCTHGTTTFVEITTALGAGKLPICNYNDGRYYIYYSSSNTVHRFASMQSDYIRYITVDNTDTWSNVQAYNLQLTSNKVTSISSASTDSQYPSAKAVYDYAQPTLVSGINIKTLNNNSLLGNGNIDISIPVESETVSDNAFELSDENGDIILQIGQDGSIQTKQFDSTNTQEKLTLGSVPNGTINKNIGFDSSGNLITNNNLPILTTAPTSANTEGGIIIVVLSSEPATKYSGYLYLITGA